MMKRNLEQDCSETKISRFKLRKSKKFWTTTSVILGSIGVVLGLITITPEKNVVYAATPPTSGTVTWTPNNSLAEITLKSGKSEKIAFLQFDSIPSYCIALGVPLTNSSTSAQQDKLNEIWSKLQAKEQAMINDIVYFANNQGAANNKNLYLGAQTAIWQMLSDANIGAESIKSIDKFGPGNPNGDLTAVTNYRESLIKQAKKHEAKPSFNGKTIKVVVGVPTLVMDTNGVLKNFPNQTSNIPGLSEKISGNNLELNADSKTKTGSGKLEYWSSYNIAPDVYFVYSTGGDSSGTVSQPVVTANDPSIQNYSLNVNVVLDGSLKIVKTQTDQDSHQGAGNIAGAKFDVTMYLSDGKTVDTGINGTFDTVDSNGKKTGTVQFEKGVAKNVTTGKDGTVTIKDFSPVGDVAKSKETYVPAPFTLGHTNATGTLVNDPMQGAITEDSTKGTAQLTFTDNKQVGGIKFKKSGLYNGSDLLNNGYQFKGTVMGVKDKDGNVVAQATLNEKGEGSTTDNSLSSPLVIGQTYTAFEISAGAGFANTFAPKEVTFTYQGANQVIDWETVSGTNTEVTGDVEFEKTMQDDLDGKTSEIEGANLSIYYDGDVKDAAGKIIHKDGDLVNLKDGLKGLPIEIAEGTQDEEAVSNVDGDLTIRLGKDNKWSIKHLPSANYKAVETQAGYGTSVSTKETVKEDNWKNNPSQTDTVEKPKGATKVGNSDVPLTGEEVQVKDRYKGSGYVPGTQVKVTIKEAYSAALKKTIPATGTATFTADKDGKVEGDILVTVNLKDFFKALGDNKDTSLVFYETAKVGDVVTVDNHNPNTPDETIKPKKPIPKIDDEKTDGKVGTPGNGMNTDKDNNIGSNDRDTADTALVIQPGQSTKIFSIDTNNGNEPLKDITWKDKTISGSAVENWSHSFKSKDGKTNYAVKVDEKTGFLVNDKGVGVVLQPGDHILSQGTLPPLTPGEVHEDQTSITGEGVISGKKVGDKDKWNGKEKTPQPHKYDLKKGNKEADLSTNILLNDDKEIAVKPEFSLTGDASKSTTKESDDTYKQEVANTAKDPKVDKTNNNSANNNNTLNVVHGQTYSFELWMDAVDYNKDAQLTHLGMVEYLDLKSLDTDTSKWTMTGASDGKTIDKSLYTITTGKEITDNKDPQFGKTPITIEFNATKEVKNSKGEKVKIIDTSKVVLSQYYKINLDVTVKSDVKPGYEIKNTAKQIVTDLDGNSFNQDTETRENQVIQPPVEVKPSKPTPTSPVNKITNIFLPQTGDAKSIMTALGAWIVTIAAVTGGIVLNERKRHTLAMAYHKFVRKFHK